jgi:hypothetical protein
VWWPGQASQPHGLAPALPPASAAGVKSRRLRSRIEIQDRFHVRSAQLLKFVAGNLSTLLSAPLIASRVFTRRVGEASTLLFTPSSEVLAVFNPIAFELCPSVLEVSDPDVHPRRLRKQSAHF